MRTDRYSIEHLSECDQPPIPRQEPGRRCRVCGKPLAVYNPDDECFCHPIDPERLRSGIYVSGPRKNRTQCNFPDCPSSSYKTGYCKSHAILIKGRRDLGWPLEYFYAPRYLGRRNIDEMMMTGAIEDEPWYQAAVEHVEAGVLGRRELKRAKKACRDSGGLFERISGEPE
jgi:hypothetical protein